MIRQPGNAVVEQLLSNDRIALRAQFLSQFVKLGQKVLVLMLLNKTNSVLLLVDGKLGILRAVKDTTGNKKGYSLFINSSSSSVKWIHA